MIKLSKLADYAIVILACMAQECGGVMSASDLAARSGLPEPTVAKVLKLLTKGAVIASVRGVNGGYRLDRCPDEVSVASVITALDGPVALAACVEGSGDCCSYESGCPVKSQWNPVNEAVKQALENVPLAQMIGQRG